MPARSGDWTSVRKRVSRSAGSAVRVAAAAVLARRAVKVRSSIYPNGLSAETGGLHRGGAGRVQPPGRTVAAVIIGLVPLDQVLHPDGVALAVTVAGDRAGAAARFDEDIGQKDAGVD